MSIDIKVPDIGDFKDVPVIEVFVKVGDTVKAEDPLISLESDKATMDVPAPQGGVVKAADQSSHVSSTVWVSRLFAPTCSRIRPGSRRVVAGAMAMLWWRSLTPRKRIRIGPNSLGRGTRNAPRDRKPNVSV